MSLRYHLGRFVIKFHKNRMGDDVNVTITNIPTVVEYPLRQQMCVLLFTYNGMRGWCLHLADSRTVNIQ